MNPEPRFEFVPLELPRTKKPSRRPAAVLAFRAAAK